MELNSYMFILDNIRVVMPLLLPLIVKALPALILIGAIAFHHRLLARFQFPLFTRHFYWAMVAFSAVPLLLYLAYATPCRHLDDLPLPWIAILVFSCAARVLGKYNCRRTNLANGLAAMLIQVLVLALVLSAGAVPVAYLMAIASMDTGGRSGQWGCHQS